MKKIVVEVSLSSNKSNSSIMTAVAKLNGIKSLKLDDKGRLTILGNVDPVIIIEALRKKNKNAKIVSVGPPEPENQYPYIHHPYYISSDASKTEHPYHDWSDTSMTVHPYHNWSNSYRPVQYVSAPYDEQPSGCVIV
ncbi:Heavy-metal-associated domain-containing protein [Carex littledalei]|uniref:Heavy-metal-associated domain-containing protein n=1 Tax=Carex littledalei TaxID=544730 RepID=A0A833QNY5_9POAL|nr:Heavy-metal-associated domain-containing protein [Carex littledalei]